MSFKDIAELVIPSADPDGTGAREFRFAIQSGEEQPIQYQPDQTLDVNQGGQRIQTLLAEVFSGADGSPYQQIAPNLGTGVQTVTLDGLVTQKAATVDGTTLQWGDDDSVGLTGTSATGQDIVAKTQVLEEVFQNIRPGSLPPSDLIGSDSLVEVQYGERHPAGVLDAQRVVPSNVTMTPTTATTATLSFTGITAVSLDEVLTSGQRQDGGA